MRYEFELYEQQELPLVQLDGSALYGCQSEAAPAESNLAESSPAESPVNRDQPENAQRKTGRNVRQAAALETDDSEP
jgi:hypothetical protein